MKNDNKCVMTHEGQILNYFRNLRCSSELVFFISKIVLNIKVTNLNVLFFSILKNEIRYMSSFIKIQVHTYQHNINPEQKTGKYLPTYHGFPVTSQIDTKKSNIK